LVFGSLLVFVGCLSTQVSNLDGFDRVSMNRVVPFPPDEELRKRAFEIVLIDRESPAIDDFPLRDPRRRLRRMLRELATQSGAIVVKRAGAGFGGLDEDSMDESVASADYALSSRFETYEDAAIWEPPFKFVWQTPEQVAGRRGTCVHRAEIALEIEVIETGDEERLRETYSLKHQAERKTRDLDESCPMRENDRENLLDEAMDEALSCLRSPLERLLAPRGHVMAHRVAPDVDRHLYQISLGRAQGMEAGAKIDIRREQHASTPTGQAWRTERVISSGVVTDQVAEQHAWVAVDRAKASEKILEGDVVRPVLSEGLLSSLSGPDCAKILDQR
jgi:hypothetical protein